MSGFKLLLLFAFLFHEGYGYTETHCQDKKQVIVHLFEWSWDSIARECEEVLGPKGFCGVQVSPPMEHIQGGQWWTRYQPVSYKLESRSGNRDQFISMVNRCNAVGVNIYVDAVINHMTGHGGSGQGTGGSSYDGPSESYPGVPFSNLDFHQPYCEISNYNDANDVRNCYLVSLNDLDGGKDYVRGKIADYYKDCINIGVKGFRVDASKHMWPGDIAAIQERAGNLPNGGAPLYFHEVIDMGGEAISASEYFGVGKTIEFRYGVKLAQCIRNGDFNCLGGIYDQGWGMADGLHAVVFVDNHDNQRGHGGAGGVLTASGPGHNDWQYKVASAFMLAHDYGFKRVMSSYYFDNSDQGPPGAQPGPPGQACGNGWTCEHRWSSIMNMVKFANAVVGTGVENWQAAGASLGFSRGNKGFVAMGDLNKEYYTGLPDGEYCDIIQDCQQKIQISGGKGYFSPANPDDPVVAICVGC
ncbi:alpha-amylase [Eurytemora carolleeae]|uniref:alpha-amylase n=1 Tax=Eurytemora carolleeae TaxID=1294199 RepID=UPI000C7702E8|nr:alpha-amylase [Eurytemora carolleeae]|eukprot:XP_023334511.1 alpha-amylase-like [Eurytemora affinis]